MTFSSLSKAVAIGLMTVSSAMALQGCTAPKGATSAPVQVQATQDAGDALAVLYNDYFQESLRRNPVYATFVGDQTYNDRFETPISAEQVADSVAFEKHYLNKLNLIDASQLSGQDWLSYEIFRNDRLQALAGAKFESHLMPISQMGGAHMWFAMLGSGSSAQPFNNAQDYRNFIKRADGFALYMDSVVNAMREGMAKKVVLPKPIARKLLPQLAAHSVDDISTSVFYGPVSKIDELGDLDDGQKAALKADYERMIAEVIVPAYKRVHDFIEQEYINAARDTVGLSGLPNGKAWYEHRISVNTTLPLTAEDIHEFGQQEVARILNEMNKVRETVGFEGDLQAFFTHLREDDKYYFESEQAVIDGYNSVKDKINARVGKLFEIFPKSDYEVRAVEAYRAASAAGASYQAPAPDGSRPGIFYINTHNLKAQPKFLMETLSIHEAAPGHHFQIAIQQEVKGLPAFRKFGGYTVFAEGWALYAESLGQEMGLFTDPIMWYGRLADEQLRAMRLVVDTGLHAFGWSREQAIDFMRENSSMAESDIVAEVERYISIGGQALAYKTGERHIRMLRNKAKAALGKQFDVRKFHTQVLIDGAIPMPILEAKIDRWIEAQQS